MQDSLTLHTATATGPGPYTPRTGGLWGYTIYVTGGATPSATVAIEVTHDGVRWQTLGTMVSSSGTDSLPPATGFFAAHRANVTALSAGATVEILASGG